QRGHPLLDLTLQADLPFHLVVTQPEIRRAGHHHVHAGRLQRGELLVGVADQHRVARGAHAVPPHTSPANRSGVVIRNSVVSSLRAAFSAACSFAARSSSGTTQTTSGKTPVSACS